MIKFEIVLGVVHPSSAKNSSSFIQVDCFHLCFYNRDMTKDAAEGIDNVAWIQISCRNRSNGVNRVKFWSLINTTSTSA
jgi:hypothetical protein